jgi:prepilin-type N-terminal cleavage/methylation domain-containing protein
MDCTITSTSKARYHGFTLVEMLVATAVGGLVLAAVMAMSLFSARSFAAISNYVDLDIKSRTALDTMTSDIRQASDLFNASSNSLSFHLVDIGTGATNVLQYTYDPSGKTLKRSLVNLGQTTTLLTNCTFMRFALFQRNSITNSYEQYDAASVATCKLIQLTWVCSRDVLKGRLVNTESVQSAKVVMRKP